MFKVENKNKAVWVYCKVNGADETIRFSPYTLDSKRSPYEISQEYGLSASGIFSEDFVPFEQDTTEHALIEFVKSGDTKALASAGLVLCDRPAKNNISRNLGIFDPKSGLMYFIGGVGLITPTEDHTHFVLNDPLLDERYGKYQDERGNPAGGTQYFSNEGVKGSINESTVGTLEYKTGLYHAVRKALENEKLKDRGVNCPSFVAAGPITSIANGKFGFTIYRSNITPEYMLNLGLYLNERAQFKKNYEDYLGSKYSQLFMLHTIIGESHGQPSITNTLCEINLHQSDNNIRCQIKDFETNHPLPTNEALVIEEGVASVPVGWAARKSPKAGAQLYDLQHALLQELNILLLPARSIQDPQQRFNYLSQQSAKLLLLVSKHYLIATEEQSRAAIQFSIDTFISMLKLTGSFDAYNEIIAGAFAHKLFSLSDLYKAQVTLFKD